MSIVVWSYKSLQSRGDGGASGVSPADAGTLSSDLKRYGHAIAVPNTISSFSGPRGTWDSRPAHDDAQFAEVGRSMAAYYENGEAFGGHWWDSTANARVKRMFGAA